jgi:hypothetical protein
MEGSEGQGSRQKSLYLTNHSGDYNSLMDSGVCYPFSEACSHCMGIREGGRKLKKRNGPPMEST